MQYASDSAINLAKSGNVNIKAINDYCKAQKSAEVTTIAKGKSLGNVRNLINEYNSALGTTSNGLTKCGLSQEEFTKATQRGNQALGNYFATLKKGSKATMMGYIGMQTKMIAQTIALSVVIASVMKALSDLGSLIKNVLFKETKSLTEEFDDLKSELSDVTSELSSLESELQNVETEMDALLEKDKLSFAEKEELSRLKRVSSELKHQISLAEALEESLNKAVSETALGAYAEYSGKTSFYSAQTKEERRQEAEQTGQSIGNVAGLIIGGIIGTALGGNTVLGAAIGSGIGTFGGGLIGGAISNASYSSEATVSDMIDKMRTERIKLEAAEEEAYKAYTDHRSESNATAWNEASQALNDYNSAMATHINKLAEYYNAVDYSTLATEKQREEYRKMGDDLDSYNIQMGVAGAKATALDRIFGEEQITDEAESLKNAIESVVNSGAEIDFWDVNTDGLEDITERLADMGITITDVIAYFEDLKEAQENASDYETHDMVASIASLSGGVHELVSAFKEFNEQGILTAETLVKLNALFGDTGDKWKNYVEIMTSGNATASEAIEATNALAEAHLNDIMKDGGLKLNKENADGTYSLDAEKYKTYLSTINELELIGVDNAKQYVDALIQQAMIQETVDKMIADSATRQTLEAKKSLNDAEKAQLNALKSKTVDDYILETENMYGVKFDDTSIIEKQKELEENKKLAADYEGYLNDVSGSLDEFNSSIERHQELGEEYDEVYAKYDKLREEGYNSGGAGSDPWGEAWEAIKEGFTFTLADTKYDEYDRLVEDLDAYGEAMEEEADLRQEYFDNMLDIAKKAGIDLSDIDVDAFSPNTYGDGSIYNQVYERLMSELEGADYAGLAEDLESTIEEDMNELGLEVELDLNIDGVILDELQTAYGLLEQVESEMAEGNGLSMSTIESLKSVEEDYLDYLYEENGLIKLNTDAWRERANNKIDNNLQAIRDEITALETQRELIEGRLEDAETEGNTYKVEKYTEQLNENTAAIETNQSKLLIYETLYNNVTGALDAYSEALQGFTEVHNAITSVSDSLTTVADLQETVANGFTISLEKALEFAKVYPEILNGATVAADGQIALNEGIVNAFIEGKEAELKAQIDAEVAKLEADKAVLTAKMEFSKAQLELAKSVGTGEGQISKEVAEYRVNAGNAVAQALIAAGIDEATAYQLACAAMAQNSEEFNRVAAEVCTDVQGNFNQAAYDAAQAIYTNMQNSKLSIASVAAQAHEAAKAIAGIASGTVQGSSSVQGGGAGGSYTGKGNISVHSGSFKGTEYTYEAKTISLEDFISDLELDISNYQQAISQIDGQIATLKALRNTSLNKFSTSNKNASKGSGSKSGSSKDDEPTWFEKEYALHQHLLKMDAENVEDYLDWLNSAYQRAYKEGIIDLDDYYKYQEEVYTGLQDLFKDYLNDVEHEISMRENYEGESDKIIELYKKLMKDVEKEIAAARAQGLDDTDDYIQELQKKWQGYAESVKDIQEDATESAKDAVAELVDYRIDMIKQDIENEKDALDKKLDYLKEFYDKQKDMLQDQYDEEKYLEEQAEKRKSVSDLRAEIAMLENDDSAWAQKRKLELQEELATAEDDLGDFEDEHALDLALDALDNAYNAQEAQIQAEMDALEEKLNDPEALYNQALTEIKNNTGNLYQEMLEYNRKHGTGNDEDVKDIYEEAYKALLEYKDIYGKDYEGVVLTNSTNYKPETGSWDTEKISGTNPDNQKKEETKPQEETKPKTETPTLTDAIKRKVAAAIWNGGYGWGTGATRTSRLNEVFGAGNGIQALVNQGVGKSGISLDSSYTYANMRKKFKGYASGTKNAVAGLHSIDELGAEYLFTSEDGSRYRVFSGGEKVLNAKATDFLYEFANGGGEILEKIIKSAFGTSLFDHIQPVVNHNEIDMGDVIVQGSATQQTVSEIRRAQRDNLTEMLKSLNKLNK